MVMFLRVESLVQRESGLVQREDKGEESHTQWKARHRGWRRMSLNYDKKGEGEGIRCAQTYVCAPVRACVYVCVSYYMSAYACACNNVSFT